MGGLMTAISLRQTARSSQFGRTAFTTANKFGQLTRDSGRNFVRQAQVLEVSNLILRPQEFASGFVDFLLGRRRHAR
jgi:hypothetical protein